MAGSGCRVLQEQLGSLQGKRRDLSNDMTKLDTLRTQMHDECTEQASPLPPSEPSQSHRTGANISISTGKNYDFYCILMHPVSALVVRPLVETGDHHKHNPIPKCYSHP